MAALTKEINFIAPYETIKVFMSLQLVLNGKKFRTSKLSKAT